MKTLLLVIVLVIAIVVIYRKFLVVRPDPSDPFYRHAVPPRPGASALAVQRQNEADWFTRLTRESTEDLDARGVSGLERAASRLAALRRQFSAGTRITESGVTLALVEEQDARVQAALDRKARDFHAGRVPGSPWFLADGSATLPQGPDPRGRQED